MNALQFFLTSINFHYGLFFTNYESKIAKSIGSFMLTFFICHELYLAYTRLNRNTFLTWIGLESYFVGSFIYGILTMAKHKQIVNYILPNIRLLNHKQYKIAVCAAATAFFLIIWDSIFLAYVLSQKWYFDTFFDTKQPFWCSLIEASTQIYHQWSTFGSVIYSLMYFITHLKHISILDELKHIKRLEYSMIYRILIKFRQDLQYFDSIISILPAVWLVHILLAMNCLYFMIVNSHVISIMAIVIKEFIVWPSVFIFINICRSKFQKEIECIKFKVAIDDSLDDAKGHAMIQLLDRISNIHVTAAHLIKLDSSLILPYIGSVCTYFFLFHDKFGNLQLL